MNKVIKKVFIVPSKSRQLYLGHSNEILIIYAFKSIRNLNIHTLLGLIKLIPEYLNNNKLTINHTLHTNFEIVTPLQYDYHVLELALCKVCNHSFIFN